MAENPVIAGDDFVLAFEVKPLGVRGRLVRLGAAVDDILHRHDYPPRVSALLAEAVALAAMLGSALKFDGRFVLQTKTDGPVDLMVADYAVPGKLRGYARCDGAKVAALGDAAEASLIGKGHLAMTVDQGPAMDRYQGIVALDGSDLTAAAHDYFARSEQIPTNLRLAAGPLVGRRTGRDAWRAGAIMVQHLPRRGSAPDPDDWVKARLLLETVEPHELLDPTVSPERLLYRLYHEDGVTVYRPLKLARHCTCSREAIVRMLQSFTPSDRAEMVHDGAITVTCEFCSTAYRFDAGSSEAA
jgi:molecular chaperone Hsp33